MNSNGTLDAYSTLKNVKEFKILGKHKIQFVLKKPFAPFINQLTQLPIASPKAIKGDVDLTQHPVGTGPFKFVEWTHGAHITVKKYDDYWKKGYPKVNKVVFKPVPEAGSRVAMLKTGAADIVQPMPLQSVRDVKKKKTLLLKRYHPPLFAM